MSKILIIYHSEDNDGRVSGALCKLKMEELYPASEIECKGYTYAELSELIKRYNSGDDFVENLHKEFMKIIMTDISFNEVGIMKTLFSEFTDSFYWFDHHAPAVKSSFENNYNNIPGFRVQGTCSAIKCVWEYFFNGLYSDADNERIPKLLNTLSAYDSWHPEQHNTTFDFANWVNKGFNIRSGCDFEKTYNIIKELLKNLNESNLSVPTMYEQNLLMDCYTSGKFLDEAEMIQNKDMISRWGDCSFILDNDESEKCCVLFNQAPLNSKSFSSLKSSSIKHGVVIKKVPYSDNYTISLYNINNNDVFDCGAYLKKKYNGGGHKGAAGATLTKQKLNKILTSKSI